MLASSGFVKKLFKFTAYSAALLVVLAALLVSLSRVLLSEVGNYHKDIENMASSMLNLNVRMGSISARMSWFTPIIQFNNVSLTPADEKQPLLDIYRIELGVSLSALIRQGKLLPEKITVSHLDIDVVRNSKGDILLQGRDIRTFTAANTADAAASAGSRNLLGLFLSNSRINIINSQIVWTDYVGVYHKYVFSNLDVMVKNSGDRHQLHAEMVLPESIGTTLQVEMDINGNLDTLDKLSGSIFIRSNSLQLTSLSHYLQTDSYALNKGVADVKFWLVAKQGRITSISSDMSLYNFALREQRTGKILNTSLFSGMFDFKKSEQDDWQLTARNFIYAGNGQPWPKSDFTVKWHYSESGLERLALQLGFVRVEDLGAPLDFLSIRHEKFNEIITKTSPTGDLRKFSLKYQAGEGIRVSTAFENVAVRAWEKLPAVKGLSGSAKFSQQGGSLYINSRYALLDFPVVFRKPFKFDLLNARVDFSVFDKGTSINIPELKIRSEYAEGNASVQLLLAPDTSPHMSLQANLSRVNVADASMFFPVNIMKPKLLNWLDQALVSGNAYNIGVVFNGSLKAFPFRNNQGRFLTDLEAENFRFRYHKDWPEVDAATIKAVFTGLGMEMQLGKGTIAGGQLVYGSASIPAFSSPILFLDTNAVSSLQQATDFLTQSPIMPGAREVTAQMELDGQVETHFKLKMPLSDNAAKQQPLQYEGKSIISAATVRMLERKLNFSSLAGTIHFHEGDQYSEEITGMFNGQQASFKLATEHSRNEIVLTAGGTFKPGDVLQKFALPGSTHIRGTSSWNAEMVFPSAKANRADPHLNVYSKLENVSIDLPEPFSKTPEIIRDTALSISFAKKNHTRLSVKYADFFNSDMLIEHGNSNSVLQRGIWAFSSQPVSLPDENELVITGSLVAFKPGQWIEKLGLDKVSKDKPEFFINPIRLDMQRFQLAEFEGNDKPGTAKQPVREPPTHLPPIYGAIQELGYGKELLGHLSFASSRIPAGMQLDSYSLKHPQGVISGRGEWTGRNRTNQTRLDFILKSGNLGRLLTDLGFAAIIDKGTAQASGNIHWPDAPSEFAFASLSGEVSLNIKDGNIRDVDVGAGKLLGLLSLSALPRRLFGDFRDLGAGFAFDKAEGEIQIINGDVFTDKYHIESVVGDVVLNGRMGLAKRDYDQKLVVIPNVGDTASLITALTVNLPFGLGVWLMDKITGEKIDKAAIRQYHISGSWEKPVIKEIKG